MTISIWWGRGSNDAVYVGANWGVCTALQEVEGILCDTHQDREWARRHYMVVCGGFWWDPTEPVYEELFEVASQAQAILESIGHRMSNDAQMVVRKLAEIIHYLRPRTVARLRNVRNEPEMEAGHPRSALSRRRVVISVKRIPKWYGKTLKWGDVKQVTGAPARGVSVSPGDLRIPDELFYVGPFARESVNRGIIRARCAVGVAGDPGDRLVSLLLERKLAAQLEGDMALLATIARLVPSPPPIFYDDDLNVWGPTKPRETWGMQVLALYREQSGAEGWDFGEVVDRDMLRVFNFSDWQAHYFKHRVSYARKPDPMFRGVDQGFWRRQGEHRIGTVVIPRSALAATGAMITEFEVREDLLLCRREIHHYGDIPLRGKARKVVRLREKSPRRKSRGRSRR